jgi:hypothetical protein
MANFGGIGDGLNMAFRRSAFQVWPGFDVRLGRGSVLYGGEEHHAFFSLLARGYCIAYTPHAVVRHPYPSSLRALRVRHLRDLAAHSAYVALLINEAPGYRLATLRYLREGLVGTKRSWRESDRLAPKIVPGWAVVVARALGLCLYVRSVLGHHQGGEPVRAEL